MKIRIVSKILLALSSRSCEITYAASDTRVRRSRYTYAQKYEIVRFEFFRPSIVNFN